MIGIGLELVCGCNTLTRGVRDGVNIQGPCSERVLKIAVELPIVVGRGVRKRGNLWVRRRRDAEVIQQLQVLGEVMAQVSADSVH